MAENIVHLLEDIKGTIEQRGKSKVDEGLGRCIEEFEKYVGFLCSNWILMTKKQYRQLQKIQQNLKGISQRNMGKRLFHATSDAETIKECKDRIKHCIDVFNVSSFQFFLNLLMYFN